jgi:hypothetical protein
MNRRIGTFSILDELEPVRRSQNTLPLGVMESCALFPLQSPTYACLSEGISPSLKAENRSTPVMTMIARTEKHPQPPSTHNQVLPDFLAGAGGT